MFFQINLCLAIGLVGPKIAAEANKQRDDLGNKLRIARKLKLVNLTNFRMHLVQVSPNKPYPNQRALLAKKSECIRSLFDNMIFHPEILRAGKIKKNPCVLRYQK